jgi:hypothetical protein
MLDARWSRSKSQEEEEEAAATGEERAAEAASNMEAKTEMASTSSPAARQLKENSDLYRQGQPPIFAISTLNGYKSSMQVIVPLVRRTLKRIRFQYELG